MIIMFSIKKSKKLISLFILFLYVLPALSLQERTPHSIPLAIVVAYYDSETGKLSEVMIKKRKSLEAWTISFHDDRYIKDGKNRTYEHTHIERPGSATSISPFEGEQIAVVLKSFEKTLKNMEKDLEGKKWGKLLYLDGRMGLFLHSFYELLAAATASYDNVSKDAAVPKELFDDSFYSEKSDKRVDKWRESEEKQLKLRISIKELIFQSQKWREEHLEDATLVIDTRTMLNFEKAYTLFVKLYFNKI